MSNYFEHDRKEVVALLPSDYQKVLEIGCGSGGFSQYLRDDCQYWGIEPSQDAAILAEKKLSKVLVGTYDQVCDDLPEQAFDLVICNDVIEHMVDHDVFLQSIKSKLTKNGVLVCSIPNVRYLQNLIDLVIKKDWQYTDSGILDRTHLRFFTEKSLKKSLIENGYDIQEFAYLNTIFTNPYTIGAIIKRFLVLLLGKDSAYVQFGVRIKPQQ